MNQRAAKALMRALYMVVGNVLADEFSQVRLTQRDDAVEALLFDRANEAFDEGVGLGRRMHPMRIVSNDVFG